MAALLGAPKSNAAPYTWNVASGASGNWSTPTSWMPTTTGPNGPLAADTVVFGTNTSSSAATPNNIVDSGFAGTVAALTYNSTNAGTFQVTQIGAGQTLTVTGSVIVGQQNGVQLITQAYMIGGGSFATIATNFQIESYGSASGANSSGNLNLSGLSTFSYNNPSGTVSIADTTSGDTRAGGNLFLASVSNSITASNINISTSSAAQAGPLSTLVLGLGSNNLNVANLNVANNKGSATVSFATPTGPIASSLKIRGVSGANTDRANITLGNRNQSGTGTCAGTMALNGSAVDIKAATLIVGNNNSPGTTGDTGTGVLQFDTGTVDATTIFVGDSITALGAANGTITVGANGTLIAGSGGISLVTQTASGVATGALVISNGNLTCNGNVTVATNAGTSSITFTGGGKSDLGRRRSDRHPCVAHRHADFGQQCDFAIHPPLTHPA